MQNNNSWAFMKMQGRTSDAPRQRNLLSSAGIISFAHIVLVEDAIKNN